MWACDTSREPDCLDAHSQFHKSSVATTACRADIANVNGVLTCSQ